MWVKGHTHLNGLVDDSQEEVLCLEKRRAAIGTTRGVSKHVEDREASLNIEMSLNYEELFSKHH